MKASTEVKAFYKTIAEIGIKTVITYYFLSIKKSLTTFLLL